MEMDVVLSIGVPVVFTLIAAGTWLFMGYRNRHHIAAAFETYQALRQTDPLFILPPGVHYQHRQWPARMQMFDHSGILVLRRTQLEIYPYLPNITDPLVFDLSGLCWFWRHRIENQRDEVMVDKLELHFHHHDDSWHLLMVTLHDDDIERFMQIFKSLTSLYPRHHAYTIFAPVTGQIALQDIHGAWTLGAKYRLFLSSVDLIIAQDKQTVIDRIPFSEIADVQAMRRIDSRMALAGLVRFSAGGKQVAFAMTQYEDFAAALAEMAGVQLQWATDRKTK